jgi:hypothetical protein
MFRNLKRVKAGVVFCGLLVAGCGATASIHISTPSPAGTANPSPTLFDTANPTGSDNSLAAGVAAACNSPRTTVDGCETASYSALAAARSGEAIFAKALPSDFWTLPYSEQTLILVNGERTARGFPPVTLSSALNVIASAGARSDSVPKVLNPDSGGSSNWSGARNTVYDDFLMMYADGYPNPAGTVIPGCRAAVTSGCWRQRENILSNWNGKGLLGAACNATPDVGYLPNLSCGEVFSPAS